MLLCDQPLLAVAETANLHKAFLQQNPRLYHLAHPGKLQTNHWKMRTYIVNSLYP